MTFEELDELRGLVDDLCLVSSGWRTDEQHDAYTKAYERICSHGWKVKQKIELERLKARVAELEKKI